MTGININKTDAIKENVPEDLNSLAYSAYRIPDIKRRKLIGSILLTILASVFLIGKLYTWIDFSYTYPLLLLIAVYTLLLSAKMSVPQSQIIELAGKHVEHPIGYYSVALTFKGLLLNPIWTCILYDHKNPPEKRSIVEINSNTGELVGNVFSETLDDNA